ncbi:hypothetical protein D037_4863B, partial [Vibrio parahaemolyticus IDH02640]
FRVVELGRTLDR